MAKASRTASQKAVDAALERQGGYPTFREEGVMSPVDLSVIIPTRDRPRLLADCLDTLAVQASSGEIEVIVVDDGSREPLGPVVSAVTSERIRFRCVRMEGAGLCAGRNRGVAESTGAVVAFLDDDTLVTPVWCEAVIGAFRNLKCEGLAGRILLQYEGPRPRWLWIEEHGYLSGLDQGEGEFLLEGGLVPTGANCAVRREWFDRLDGFRLDLDRNGQSLLSGGDTDFFRRLITAGGLIGYSGRACVRHRVPPERLKRRFFFKRGMSQGVSDALMEGKPTTLGEHKEWWLRTFYFLGRAPLVLAKNVVNRRGSLTPITWCGLCIGRIRVAWRWYTR